MVSQDCKTAIHGLHTIWKGVSLNVVQSRFFDMKRYHTVISSEFEQNDDTPWNDYIQKGLKFRTNLMFLTIDVSSLNDIKE
jgi:hypothetical protein